MEIIRNFAAVLFIDKPAVEYYNTAIIKEGDRNG